jgi:hypothetical protein
MYTSDHGFQLGQFNIPIDKVQYSMNNTLYSCTMYTILIHHLRFNIPIDKVQYSMNNTLY